MTNLNDAGRNLTKNTKELKNAVELTIAELSWHTGVSETTLRRIEAARKARRAYRPMLSTVVKLADFADLTVDDYINNRLTFQ
jgi:DNA-binding XRE family transcriptional regulator